MPPMPPLWIAWKSLNAQTKHWHFSDLYYMAFYKEGLRWTLKVMYFHKVQNHHYFHSLLLFLFNQILLFPNFRVSLVQAICCSIDPQRLYSSYFSIGIYWMIMNYQSSLISRILSWYFFCVCGLLAGVGAWAELGNTIEWKLQL